MDSPSLVYLVLFFALSSTCVTSDNMLQLVFMMTPVNFFLVPRHIMLICVGHMCKHWYSLDCQLVWVTDNAQLFEHGRVSDVGLESNAVVTLLI